jgi:DNA polymerase III delta prime subunit
MDLHLKYRPREFADVIGQDSAVSTLEKLLEKNTLPHALMFVGPSGCGKTTLARIVARKVGCHKNDLQEKNCAIDRGIELVREIRKCLMLKPIAGDCRVYILDEYHQLTEPSQQSLLKMLEEAPSHVYFCLATTDPHDLLSTIRTRCTDIRVASLADHKMEELLQAVCRRAKLDVPEAVLGRIVSTVDGSPRKALVVLQQIAHLESEEIQLQAVEDQDYREDGIKVARALFDPSTDWKKMSTILKALKPKTDAEGLRYLVLGYANTVMLNSGKFRAFEVIEAFHQPLYSSKLPGFNAVCYELVALKKKGK